MIGLSEKDIINAFVMSSGSKKIHTIKIIHCEICSKEINPDVFKGEILGHIICANCVRKLADRGERNEKIKQISGNDSLDASTGDFKTVS